MGVQPWMQNLKSLTAAWPQQSPRHPHVQSGEVPPLPRGSRWGLSPRSCCLQQFSAPQHFERCAVKDDTFWKQMPGFNHSILRVTSGRLQSGRGLLGHDNTHPALPCRRTVAPWLQVVILLLPSLYSKLGQAAAKQAVDTQRCCKVIRYLGRHQLALH